MSYCKPFERKLYEMRVVWRSQNFGANATIYGPHSGNDDAAPIGTAVHAAGDGYIEWAGEFDDTYQDNLLWLLKMGGNIAVLNCGADAPSFVYGHMHSFTVKRGDRVRKGQVIGYSGNTGTATTGAHLHTEAIPPGYALNSPMLGRANPDIYLTEWPEDINTGSLSYASETITPLSEEDDMSEALDTLNLLKDRQLENHLVTQGKLDANHLTTQQKLDGNHLIIQRRLDGFASEIAGMRAAFAAVTTNPGITPEALTAAFKDAAGEFSITLSTQEVSK